MQRRNTPIPPHLRTFNTSSRQAMHRPKHFSMESLSKIYASGDGVAQNLELSEYWKQQSLNTVDPNID